MTVIPTQRYGAERARRADMVDLRGSRSTLPSARVANASMIMTYDRSRIAARAGPVSRETLRAVDSALALHLGIEAARGSRGWLRGAAEGSGGARLQMIASSASLSAMITRRASRWISFWRLNCESARLTVSRVEPIRFAISWCVTLTEISVPRGSATP